MTEKRINSTADESFRDEVRQMVANPEFRNEKSEFSQLTGTYNEKCGGGGRDKTTETRDDRGWELLKTKIVEILPAYLTDGIVLCSLEKIGQEEQCRKAADENRSKLVIKPGSGFPAITFPTFCPYIDFILRAGPVDLLHKKTYFKVEGSMVLDNAVIEFRKNRVDRVSGQISVSAKISLCKGKIPVKLHEFKKTIDVK
jgi:hypothetical protein